MVTGRITVGPMNHASSCVPRILTLELNGVTRAERRDPWREIDVVSDQNLLARTETDDETLVTTAIVVVRENLGHLSLALNPNIAEMIRESTVER